MKDIKEIRKTADEDIRTFGEVIDMVVAELTCGDLGLPEEKVSLYVSMAEIALMDYQLERMAQADADIGMAVLRRLFDRLP